ncbi:MAG TPA: cache domain-containing protein [Vicinamibacteria bacterium]
MKKALAFTAAGLLLSLTAAAADKGTPQEAQAMLDKAVAAVKADEAKALAAFNDPKGGFVDRDLYVFCFDKTGTITAHGANKAMIGTDTTVLKDPDGKAIGAEMMALAGKGGGSIEYKWKSPTTNQVATKVSFIKSAGNQTCGVGAYK